MKLTQAGVELAHISFPERLQELMGPTEVQAPEVNPVPRHEAVRHVNGLPRASRGPSFFEPPASTMSREVAIDRFLDVTRGRTGPEQQLARLLVERRRNQQGIRAAVMQGGWTSREI